MSEWATSSSRGTSSKSAPHSTLPTATTLDRRALPLDQVV